METNSENTDQHAHASPQPRQRGTAVPVLVLFLLSPLIGELAGAALRFSNFAQPPRVLGILCFYGAGVVLIREIVQRMGLNAWGLSLLGIAYALLEEGIGLQTIFNPQGMSGETVWGRAFGVNWIWAVAVIGFHVVWSIVIPIVLAHLLFPDRRDISWLSRPASAVFAVVFALGLGTFLFISLVRSDFRLSALQIGGTLALVIVLGWTATRCRKPLATVSTKRSVKPATAGWFGFGTGLVWLVLYMVAIIGTRASFVWWLLGALLFAAFVALVLRRWVVRADWGARHRLAAGFGAVVAAWVFGLALVANGGRVDDVVFHVVLLVVFLVGFWWLRRRTPSVATPEPSP